MSHIEEISVLGAAEGHAEGQRIRNWINRLLSFPGMRSLRPLARRVGQVAETPGKLSIQTRPAKSVKITGGNSLTVISANLYHDWPKHRQSLERLEAFAALVEKHQADVLLLQEVARTADLWTDRWLAERLGMSFVYSRANGHLEGIGFEEGVAVFSRHPLGKPVLRQLSSSGNPFVRRMALGTQISSPLGDLLAFSVHLGIGGKQNVEQAKRLRDWVQELSMGLPALVGGDFNADETSRSIRSLRKTWTDTFRQLNPWADGTTHVIRWPWGKALKRARLDYIFLKAEKHKWKVLEALHLETPEIPYSDHRAVLLRLAPVYITK